MNMYSYLYYFHHGNLLISFDVYYLITCFSHHVISSALLPISCHVSTLCELKHYYCHYRSFFYSHPVQVSNPYICVCDHWARVSVWGKPACGLHLHHGQSNALPISSQIVSDVPSKCYILVYTFSNKTLNSNWLFSLLFCRQVSNLRLWTSRGHKQRTW